MLPIQESIAKKNIQSNSSGITVYSDTTGNTTTTVTTKIQQPDLDSIDSSMHQNFYSWSSSSDPFDKLQTNPFSFFNLMGSTAIIITILLIFFFLIAPILLLIFFIYLIVHKKKKKTQNRTYYSGEETINDSNESSFDDKKTAPNEFNNEDKRRKDLEDKKNKAIQFFIFAIGSYIASLYFNSDILAFISIVLICIAISEWVQVQRRKKKNF